MPHRRRSEIERLYRAGYPSAIELSMRFAVLAIAAAAVDAGPAPEVGRLAMIAVVIVGVDALPRPHYDSIDAIVGAENVGKLQGASAPLQINSELLPAAARYSTS